jgi:hypothetical protein
MREQPYFSGSLFNRLGHRGIGIPSGNFADLFKKLRSFAR